MRGRMFLTVLLLLIWISSSSAWIMAVKGGKIFTMSDGVIENGIILIENNKITAVGQNIEIPSQAQVIDATGKIVLPGLIDAYSQIGLVEIGAVPQTVDIEESSNPMTPEVRVIDAFNTQSLIIPITRIEGVTTALVAPGDGNFISGQCAIIDLIGDNITDMIVRSPAGLHINFGESPTSKWRSKHKIETRMGLVATLRQKFIEAYEYRESWNNYYQKIVIKNPAQNQSSKKKIKDAEKAEKPSQDLGLDAIVLALDKKIPVIAAANRKDDILAAARFAEEFDLKMIVLFGTESYMVTDVLKQKNIPVLLGPITTQPSSMETLGATYECAALLEKAGIEFAIITGGAHNVRDLRFQAGIAVQFGLTFEEALKAITINPAKILGVEGEIGSIQKNRIANIAIFDGDPLQPLTKVSNVIIEGRLVPLESYQTALYDKYK